MKARTKIGIVAGVIYGIMVSWGAFYQTLSDGGLLILATVTLGIAGGLIAGGLLFLLIAMCPSEDERTAGSSEHHDEYRAAA